VFFKGVNLMSKPENEISEEDLKYTDEVIDEKLIDMETPGFQAEFNAAEAERIGAFEENALTLQDAIDSTMDQLKREGS